MIGNMYLYIYDSSFVNIALIDHYQSLIWTDRYSEPGDFELTINYDPSLLSIIKRNYYCRIDYSDRCMVIEKIELTYEEDEPPTMIVTGRSVECILERRVVTEKVSFSSANLQNSVHALLNTNIISPTDMDRQIPNFIFSESEDPAITDLTITESYNGEDLLSIISGICNNAGIGFKIAVVDDAYFVFVLYSGVNRSYSQSVNNYVVFSPLYDNLKSSSYYVSNEDYRNVMYVSINEDGFYCVSLSNEGYPSGLSRYECHEDVSNMVKNKSAKISESAVISKARKKMKKDHPVKVCFEGDVIPNVLYEYITDYYTGDIVQFQDAYGNQQALRIGEMVISCDENGLEMVPGFSAINE